MAPDKDGWIYGDPTVGTIARIVRDRGFAFVQVGEFDYFLHCSDFSSDFQTLKEQDKVRFTPATTPKGLRATDASRAGL